MGKQKFSLADLGRLLPEEPAEEAPQEPTEPHKFKVPAATWAHQQVLGCPHGEYAPLSSLPCDHPAMEGGELSLSLATTQPATNEELSALLKDLRISVHRSTGGYWTVGHLILVRASLVGQEDMVYINDSGHRYHGILSLYEVVALFEVTERHRPQYRNKYGFGGAFRGGGMGHDDGFMHQG